jgi:hypothetical protein
MMAHRCFKMSGELNGTGEESGPKRSIAFYVCLVEYHLIKAHIKLRPRSPSVCLVEYQSDKALKGHFISVCISKSHDSKA